MGRGLLPRATEANPGAKQGAKQGAKPKTSEPLPVDSTSDSNSVEWVFPPVLFCDSGQYYNDSRWWAAKADIVRRSSGHSALVRTREYLSKFYFESLFECVNEDQMIE